MSVGTSSRRRMRPIPHALPAHEEIPMTAVQIPFDEYLRYLEPPPLVADELDFLPEEEIAELLVARFRAFVRRELDWRRALLLAVSPGA